MSKDTRIENAYQLARERYAAIGVDTNAALTTLSKISLSLHCWQGDDVGGFERPGATLAGGGIQVTGNYPGKARTLRELRMDLERALSLLPGRHRVNLHAMYGDFGGSFVDRDAIEPGHFQTWIDWAREKNVKLDFNSTCFSHPLAASGFTLSSPDPGVRKFWIEHVRRCREVSAAIGKSLTSPCIHDLWIPDGAKDVTVNRWAFRERLCSALDEIFTKEYDPGEMKDALESKLFGIGSESFVVGSHEFYLGYAFTRGRMLCIDMGHFHPTESVADKLSALLLFSKELLLHISRGVRWDSDHVVILNDDVRNVTEEIVSAGALDRVYFALDYFDASMHRVGAWVIGARAALKGILVALLQPYQRLRNYETAGNAFARLALQEEVKALPFGAVWDYHCLSANVPPGDLWMEAIQRYEADVTSKRT